MQAKNLKKTILIPVIYLALWEGLSLLVGKAYLIPPPVETLKRFFALLILPDSWIRAGLTLLRVLAGYGLGVLLGILLGAFCARFAFAEELLSPLRSVIKATPVTSIILLAILFLTSGTVPVFISFLMVLPLVWSSVYGAIKDVDPKLLEMARAFRFTKKQTLKLIYAPAVQPALLAACTTALGFAWKSGVAAEILSLPKKSVGYMLYESKLTLETIDLFAWTLIVILLSMGIERLVRGILRRLRHD